VGAQDHSDDRGRLQPHRRQTDWVTDAPRTEARWLAAEETAAAATGAGVPAATSLQPGAVVAASACLRAIDGESVGGRGRALQVLKQRSAKEMTAARGREELEVGDFVVRKVAINRSPLRENVPACRPYFSRERGESSPKEDNI